MDTFENYYPLSERKSDLFYEKKNQKPSVKKYFYCEKGADFIIVKTNNKKPAKRCRECHLENDFVLNVPYSMNRKYRFQTVDPNSLLQNFNGSNDHIVVHEQIISNVQAKNALKSKYHETDAGTLSTRLGNINTLISQSITKKKRKHGDKRRKNKQNLTEDKENESNDFTLYTISKCLTRSANNNKNNARKTHKRAKKHCKLEWMLDNDLSLDCFSLPFDDSEPVVKCNDSKELPIEDYLCRFGKKQARAELLEAHNEPADITIPSSSSVTPSVLEFPKEILNNFCLEAVYKTDCWRKYDFAEEVEKIMNTLPNGTKFTWLTSTHSAFTIQLFEPIYCYPIFPIINITIELGSFQTLLFRMDGNFAFAHPETARKIQEKLLKRLPKSLNGLIQWSLQILREWDLLEKTKNIHTIELKFAADRTFGNKRIQNLEEHDLAFEYQHTSAILRSDLDTKDDEELLDIVKHRHEGDSRRESCDYEVIESENSILCSSCNTVASSGKALLNCLHNVCINCLRGSLISQLRADAFPLHCPAPTCATAVPLEIVACLLPIPHFIFYVRRSLKNLENRNGRKTACCPACLRIGVVPNTVNFKIIRCKKCFACFCSICGNSPHWPLDCRQAEYWIKRFEQTGKYVEMRLNGELREKIIVRKCFLCDREVEGGDQAEAVYCPYDTLIRYNWITGKTVPCKCKCEYYVRGKYYKMEVISADFVRDYAPTYLVEARYCKKWFQAKQIRKLYHSTSSLYQLHKRNESRMNSLDIPCSLAAFIERETAVHYLMEYGWIWLYIHRNDGNLAWKEIHFGLNKIAKLWENIEEELQSDTLPEVANTKFQQLISGFDRILHRVISSFEMYYTQS